MSETAPRRLESDPEDATSPIPDDHAVRDLPNSCKLVYIALQTEGPLTKQAIAHWTGMPERTVRSTFEDLVDAGILIYWTYTQDTRKYVYDLARTGGDA